MVENKIVTEVIEKEPYIDVYGNISYRQGASKFCVYLEENIKNFILKKKVTKDYYYIREISDDYFEVCDINDVRDMECGAEFDDSKLSFKFGVIKLQRNTQGNIIPMAEKVIIPTLYHDFWHSNLHTLCAEVNKHFTYIDINPESKNFGKQLVPLILEYAEPFSEKYEGFARCMINGASGYLYRYIEPRTTFSETELLTEEQVKSFLEKIENNNFTGDFIEEKYRLKI